MTRTDPDSDPTSSAPRVAIVTGGARGIGRGCALARAEKGFDIALVDVPSFITGQDFIVDGFQWVL